MEQLKQTAAGALEPLWQSCERFALRRPLAFALIAVGLLFAVLFAVLTPGYATIDDAIMSMIASGTGVSLAPDEHLIFTNVTIGFALKWLYTLAANVPWYGVYLLAVNYAAQTALLYAAISWRYARLHAALFYLCFSIVGVHLFVNLQFTSTAMIATESGLLLALTALHVRATAPDKRCYGMLAGGVALMWIGSLVRWQAFLGTLGFSAPVAAVLIWRLKGYGSMRAAVLQPALATALATFALAGGCQFVHYQHYQRDPQWRKFLELNFLRAPFNDFGWTSDAPEARSLLASVGWSPNDYAMIENWFYDDPTIYSADRLRTLLADPALRKAAGWRQIPASWQIILRDPAVWPILLCLPLLLWAANDRRGALVLLGISLASIAVMLSASMFVKAPPPRVYYPAFAFPVLMELLLVRVPARQFALQGVATSNGRARSGAFGFAALMVATCGLVWTEYRDFRHSRGTYNDNRGLKAALATIKPGDDQLFVNWGYPCELLPTDSPAALRHAHLLILGWLQQSPLQAAMKEHFNLGDVVPALYRNPNVFLISVPHLNSLCTVYAREHYQAHLNWRRCYASEQFPMWKPELAAPPSAGAKGTEIAFRPIAETSAFNLDSSCAY